MPNFVLFKNFFIMEKIKHFSETNADEKLKSMIEECVVGTELSVYEVEKIILPMPICARAPLLALYFNRVYGIVKDNSVELERFVLLVKLFQTAVRIYERHVLYGASNRFIGTDRFDNKNVKQLIENLKMRQQTNTFKLDSVIDNDPYYKEVLFDVRNVNCRLKATISDYFVKKVMQLVALYAHDVQSFYMYRKTSIVCDEQYYKQTWMKYELLTIKSLFFLNDLVEEEFAEFFENYSLR